MAEALLYGARFRAAQRQWAPRARLAVCFSLRFDVVGHSFSVPGRILAPDFQKQRQRVPESGLGHNAQSGPGPWPERQFFADSSAPQGAASADVSSVSNNPGRKPASLLASVMSLVAAAPLMSAA